MDASLRKVLGIIFMCTIYLLPFGISLLRDRENKIMIFFINFFGGAILIGWFIAFFMALKARSQPIIVNVNNSKDE